MLNKFRIAGAYLSMILTAVIVLSIFVRAIPRDVSEDNSSYEAGYNFKKQIGGNDAADPNNLPGLPQKPPVEKDSKDENSDESYAIITSPFNLTIPKLALSFNHSFTAYSLSLSVPYYILFHSWKYFLV